MRVVVLDRSDIKSRGGESSADIWLLATLLVSRNPAEDDSEPNGGDGVISCGDHQEGSGADVMVSSGDYQDNSEVERIVSPARVGGDTDSESGDDQMMRTDSKWYIWEEAQISDGASGGIYSINLARLQLARQA